MASAAGNSSMVETLGSSSMAAGRNNIAFISYFILGKLDDCLEVLLQSNRFVEKYLGPASPATVEKI